MDIYDAGIFAIKQGGALGVLLSINGFPDGHQEAFTRPPSFIGIDGSDIFLVLDQRVRLDELLRQKMNVAMEAGSFFFSAKDMILE